MNIHPRDIIERNRKIERVLNRSYKDLSKRFTTVKGKRFAKVLQTEMRELQKTIHFNIEQDVKAYWNLANKETDQIIDGYLQNVKVSEHLSKSFRAPNLGALNTFLTRTEKGMNLSKRVWTLTDNAQTQIEEFLASGITVGKSSVLISKDLNRYMNGKGVQYKGTLLKARNINWQAFRLATTEMNMAFRLSEEMKMQKLPFITGCTISLSGAHPAPDICDELVGEYPKWFVWGGWHPICICIRTWNKLPVKDFVQFMKTGQIAKSRFITKMSPQMNAFMKANAEKLRGYIKRGTEPLWIQDNFTKELAVRESGGAVRIPSIGMVAPKVPVKPVIPIIPKVPKAPIQTVEEYMQGLSKVKKETIESYTKGGYQVNGQLREGYTTHPKFVNDIAKILNKAPKYKGIAYRSMKFFPDEPMEWIQFKNNLKKRNIFTDKGFLSATTEKKIVNKFIDRDDIHKVIFKIKSKKGINISYLSASPKEKEILFNINSTFKINNIKKGKKAGMEIINVFMEEI